MYIGLVKCQKSFVLSLFLVMCLFCSLHDLSSDAAENNQPYLHAEGTQQEAVAQQHAVLVAAQVALDQTLLDRLGEGVVDVVRHLLQLGANVNMTILDDDNFRETLLHRVARSGSIAMLNLLLEQGAIVDALDTDGSSALHQAALKERADVLLVLIGAGAKVDLPDNDGATALHFAANSGNEVVLRVLLGAGASVTNADLYGVTPLHYAAGIGSVNVVQMLLKAGARVNAANERGITALHWAAMAGHIDVMLNLLAAGAAAGIFDFENKVALDWAVVNRKKEAAKVLRQAMRLQRSNVLV